MATQKTILRSTQQEVFVVPSIRTPPQKFSCNGHDAERVFRSFAKHEGTRSKMKGEIMVVKKSNLQTIVITEDMKKVTPTCPQ